MKKIDQILETVFVKAMEKSVCLVQPGWFVPNQVYLTYESVENCSAKPILPVLLGSTNKVIGRVINLQRNFDTITGDLRVDNFKSQDFDFLPTPLGFIDITPILIVKHAEQESEQGIIIIKSFSLVGVRYFIKECLLLDPGIE